MLSELYGMSGTERAQRIEKAIARSLVASLEMQRWPKDRADDQGGWRYIDDFDDQDSDLSITGWKLMFLRSARNAGFDVPKPAIDEAVAYVRRSLQSEVRRVRIHGGPGTTTRSRGDGGRGNSGARARRVSQLAGGEWLGRVAQGLQLRATTTSITRSRRVGRTTGTTTACSTAARGCTSWAVGIGSNSFRAVVRTLLANQEADGSWPAESHFHDGQFGNAYTTALVVMTLGAPNQLLPIFQR